MKKVIQLKRVFAILLALAAVYSPSVSADMLAPLRAVTQQNAPLTVYVLSGILRKRDTQEVKVVQNIRKSASKIDAVKGFIDYWKQTLPDSEVLDVIVTELPASATECGISI